jgi:small basic protein (TIGR04137 family)
LPDGRQEKETYLGGKKMSVHPSFKSGKNKQQKSVLKRLSRVLLLQKEGKWQEETGSVFGLPKVKVVKMKFKKDKKAEEETAAPGAAAAQASTTAPAKPKDAAPKAKGKDKK